ncbi:MAG: hypothetical protein PVG86_00595 [Desulfobacterales bacterium]
MIKRTPKDSDDSILPITDQIKSWRKASRKMAWGIPESEFDVIGASPGLTDKDRRDGFVGVILSYGFGQDGHGNADAVLSGKWAWEYACKRRRVKTWQCEDIYFDRFDCFRLRPEAPPRPKGFYFSKFQTGERYLNLKMSQLIERLDGATCCGPEGIQLLTITHTHFTDMMNDRKMPFMAFGDYQVAPHGSGDFSDALQMFCSQDILGLGIGKVDINYPLFGIPTLRF